MYSTFVVSIAIKGCNMDIQQIGALASEKTSSVMDLLSTKSPSYSESTNPTTDAQSCYLLQA